MIYQRPFVTSTFVAYEGDLHSRSLSLAVRLVDDFTRRPPDVRLRVSLRPALAIIPIPRSVRGASGVYCFEDAANGNYMLSIETEGSTSPIYLTAPVLVTIPLPALPDPTIPLLEVTLSPSSAYPFPGDATLVRGVVTSTAMPNGLPDAVVSTTYDQVDPADEFLTLPANITTRTDADGQFALFFRRLPATSQQVTVTAVQGPNEVQANIIIAEGTTQMLSLPALP
jgi:hypothetical protein